MHTGSWYNNFCMMSYAWQFSERDYLSYRKVPKFSDARKLCCNLPKIQTKSPNLRVFYQKDANGIANSEDPDQTAPSRSSLIWSALFARTYLSEI